MKNKIAGRMWMLLVISALLLPSLPSCGANGTDGGVIIGKDGWLFEGKNEEKNTDSIADYKGANLFTETELKQILSAFNEKVTYYKEYGAELRILLIPNSATVYEDCLPSNIKSKKSETTRLKQVADYIRANSEIKVLDLTETLKTAAAQSDSPDRRLYDNTGTTWNSYGAFIGYDAVMEDIKPLYEKNLYVKTINDFEISSVSAEGKSLSELTGKPEKYPNNDVIMSQSIMTLAKKMPSASDKIDLTYIPGDDIMLKFAWANLMFLGDDYLDNLKQFIGESCRNAAFVKNYNNHSSLLMQIKPEVVYFEFAEKNLGTLLSLGGVVSSDEHKTAAPVIIGKTYLGSDRYCIAGKGEDGAVISVQGGKNPVNGVVTNGQFIVETFIENPKEGALLYVFAAKDGKDESDPAIVEVTRSEKRQEKPVFVGKENHLHYNETIPDFLGSSLYSDNELSRIKKNFEGLQQKLADAGLKTKVILMVAPNHGTIYPETMPDFIQEQKASGNSRLFQLMDYMKDSTIKFITPYQRMMDAKKDGLVFNLTDTHWNELGAYQGYYELFDYIGQDFPAAKPIPMEELDVKIAEVNGGDIIPMLNFDQNNVKEWTTNVRVKPENQTTIKFNTDEILYQDGWYHQGREYDRGDPERPTVMMYRDSFSIAMMSLISETAGKTVFRPMWDYSININDIIAVNPDYLIIERVERSIGDLPNTAR